MDEPKPAVPTQVESGQRSRRHAFTTVIVAMLVLAVAAGAFVVYVAYARERDAKTAVARASAILESAEADLLTVDEAVQVQISSVTATQAVAAATLAEDVRADALEASEIIDKAMSNLPQDQMDLAGALKESADARAEMMEIAPEILEADARAAEAISYADQAVAEIKAAEALSAQAAGEFNRHTADSVRSADALSVQAESRLGAASSLLTSATASFPGADFTPFAEYVNAKVGLVALAKEINALWLAGDVAGSNAKLAAYNQRDAEVVALAQALPPSVRDPIADAYEAATEEDLAKYFDARERARIAGERVSKLRQATSKTE